MSTECMTNSRRRLHKKLAVEASRGFTRSCVSWVAVVVVRGPRAADRVMVASRGRCHFAQRADVAAGRTQGWGRLSGTGRVLMLYRRTVLGAALAVAARLAHAQDTRRLPRIGVLWHARDRE